MRQVFENVACTICGCVCDDLRITVESGQIVRAERACRLAEPWFLGQDRSEVPSAMVRGRTVSHHEAFVEAGRILESARFPLIYGLSRSSTDGQRAAVRLAEVLGATIDTTASRCHAPSIMALQTVGESTSSLGEVKIRSDLVIYWGSNPLDSHPRHLERYAVEPCGLFVPRGRRDRHVVVVDIERTATADVADSFVQVEPGRDFDTIWALRQLLRAGSVERRHDLGAAWSEIEALAQRMKSCRSGVVFFGLGLTKRGLGHLNVEALLRLVTDLNRHTRFYARRMRVPGDVAGADSVLCWQTGYPFSVNLSRGYPRYNPGEFSANEMLERGEPDACVLVGSESLGNLTEQARERLRVIPTIALDYPSTESTFEPTVRFTTAVYGVHLAGTAYRMDEIPIPLRPVLSPRYPSDAEVFNGLADNIPR